MIRKNSIDFNFFFKFNFVYTFAKKIIIISGDPNSINSEIIYKSLKSLNKSLKKRVILISNRLMLEKQLIRLKYTLKLQEIKDISENIESNKIGIFNLDCEFKDPFKVSQKNASIGIYNLLPLIEGSGLNPFFVNNEFG